jgi:hypothetical protein
MFLFYPAVSPIWYRLCKQNSDTDAKYFFWYGVSGIVVIIGFVLVCMEPESKRKLAVAFFACIPYIFGSIEQSRLIAKKLRSSKEEDIMSESGKRLDINES